MKNTYERGTMNYYIKMVLDNIAYDLNNGYLFKNLEDAVKNDEINDALYEYFSDYIEIYNDNIAKFLLVELGDLDAIYEEMESSGYNKSIDLMHHIIYTEFSEKISSFGLLDMLQEYGCDLKEEVIEILNTEYDED